MWDNCRAFNYEGDDFWKAGAKCEAKFGKLWCAAGLPTAFTAPAQLPVVAPPPAVAAAAALESPTKRIKVRLPAAAAASGGGSGLKVGCHPLVGQTLGVLAAGSLRSLRADHCCIRPSLSNRFSANSLFMAACR